MILDTGTLIKQISLRVPKAELVPGETLLFLAEIHDCPNARTALKFLTQDGRFDVIASGSLLGINYKEVASYPVDYVEHLEMHSLDLEEFLWANGVMLASVADIREYFVKRKAVPPAIHECMTELFKEYIMVGGMPRAVDGYYSNPMQKSAIPSPGLGIADFHCGSVFCLSVFVTVTLNHGQIGSSRFR